MWIWTKKSSLKTLGQNGQETDITFAAGVFEETLLKGLKDPDSIWATYQEWPLTPLKSESNPSDKVPELNEYTIDSTVYDTLLKGWCS